MFGNQELLQLVIISFILVTQMFDSGVILQEEIRCSSLFGVNRLRLLPTFRGRKTRFLFYLTKLNSNIQPNVSIKKNMKSLKAQELSRETYFQIKVPMIYQVSQSLTWAIPLGEFSRQPLMLGLGARFSCYFHFHRARHKIYMWKLFVNGKIFAHGKIKSGRKSLKKKTGPKKKKKDHSVK